MKILLLLTLISCASNQDKITPEKKSEIYYNYGTSNLMSQDYSQAVKNLRNAYQLNPKSSKINNNLGMAYYFKKNEELALEHIRQAIKLDKENTDAKMNLASIYLESEKLDLAKEQYKLMLKDLAYDKHNRTYYNLGLIEMKQENPAGAITYFRKALEVEEGYCPAHFKIGEIAFSKRNFNLALKEFHEASKGTCYSDPAPIYFQAMTLLELDKKSSALVKLDELIQRFPKSDYAVMAHEKITEVADQKDMKTIQAIRSKNRHILSDDF